MGAYTIAPTLLEKAPKNHPNCESVYEGEGERRHLQEVKGWQVLKKIEKKI